MTPAETKRHWMINALVGFGLVVTLMASVITLIIWLGDWGVGTETTRLDLLGRGLIIYLALTGAVIGALALGGPVGRWKAKIGSAELSASDDDAPITKDE